MTEEPDRQQAAGDDMTKKDADEEMTTARVSFAMQACTINCSVAGSVCRALHTARHRGLLVLSCCGSYEVAAMNILSCIKSSIMSASSLMKTLTSWSMSSLQQRRVHGRSTWMPPGPPLLLLEPLPVPVRNGHQHESQYRI